MPRVLIVEDDRGLLDMMAMVIKDWGYEVDAAISGPEAIRMIADNCPDIIMSDLVMPEMGGLELLDQVRSTKVCPSPFFVLLTGHGNVSIAVEAVKHGANEVLLKPLDFERLRELLKRYAPDKVVQIAERKTEGT